MHKRPLNKEDIYIFHWHTIGSNFESLYSLGGDNVYEIKIKMPDTLALSTNMVVNIIHKYGGYELISSKLSDCSLRLLTLEELLNHPDKAMTGTQYFKDRYYTYLRDQKIKTIIYGE